MWLRYLAPSDCELLFRWRNDPLTRANSHNTEEVSFEDHRAWFERSQNMWERSIKIAEVDAVPVAVVRADAKIREHEVWAWELSWTVSPQHRGKGYGKEAVRLFISHFRPGLKLVATVKASNLASRRIAEATGMKLVSEEGELLSYEITADASTYIRPPMPKLAEPEELQPDCCHSKRTA